MSGVDLAPRHLAVAPPPTPPTYLEWSVWGTYAHLAVADPDLLAPARTVTEALLDRIGAACSRFRPDSDLTRANVAAGSWVCVDDLLVEAVRVAVTAAHDTDGAVDPCLGRPLAWLGYDADLATVISREEPGRWAPALPAPRIEPEAWRRIGLAPGRIQVPEGVLLDLGATAKAWAADLVAATVAAELGTDVLISLGGDVAVDGWPRTWPIAISERPNGPVATTVALDAGGLATSSTTVRRWSHRGTERHHLLDPRTGRPVEGPWRTVTATGPTALAANVASTAAIVLGPDAVAWLDDREVTARLTDADGRVVRVGGWPEDS